ncbi:Dispase autolysis-inducing protein precursor [Planctomycetes bacterium Poly30]|uniref:Dispase autolysis-inducing protein n=1 Tax=Saltatorellus ferox TaxID=2528018 RepID=A0A518EW09_9BACT|nr:Dispase autolysis-inducing protein precursor [Planctomycetes bacterium Poly30]
MALPSLMTACCLLTALAPSSQEPEPVTGGAARIAAWEQHSAMTAALPEDAPAWRALGPKNCGGRIEAVDSPRGKPGVIYAGVGSGGVWKSVNGGLSWKHVFANESTFAIGDVTVDPNDENTVWVGTGEAHLGGMSYDGTGVFRSIDGGETWENRGLVDSARIGKVLIDPRNSKCVHVAVIGPRRGAYEGRGVHVSRDGGATWEQTLFAGDEVGIIDLARDPFDPDRLWAAAWDRTRRGEGGVFRSNDGGATWKKLEGGLLTGNDVGRVAVAASAAREGVVYALMVDHSPPGEGRYDVGGALYRSDDGGDSWARTSKEYVDTYVGWDFCDVIASPDDADQVYVCGFRLMVSQDGGVTFQRGGEKVFRLQDHPGQGMHLDMHDLWIDPGNPDRILLGTDGGLYVSMDRAKSWLHLNNLPIAEFYTVYLDGAEPFGIWGGTQDNASLTAPSTASLEDALPDDWTYVFLDPWDGGDGFSTFPDPSGDGTVYYEQQNGEMRRKSPGAPLRWGRESGQRITPRAGEGEPALRFAWNTPFFPSRHGENVLYCAAQGVYRSTDRGDGWKPISEDLTGGHGSVTALAESPLDPSRLAAGAGRGHVSVTTDGGESWTNVGPNLPRNGLLRLALSPHDPERIHACLSGMGMSDVRPYLYVTEDFGATWSWLGEALPHAGVNVVLEDPAQDGTLYAGTDLGVYTSRDGGKSWNSLSKGFPTAPVLDLALHSKSQTLVAVTHGLSAFALELP